VGKLELESTAVTLRSFSSTAANLELFVELALPPTAAPSIQVHESHTVTQKNDDLLQLTN